MVPGCGAVFTGTEDVVMSLAGQHAARDHGADVTDAALVAQVRAAMHAI